MVQSSLSDLVDHWNAENHKALGSHLIAAAVDVEHAYSVQTGVTCITQRQLLECWEPQRGRVTVDGAAVAVVVDYAYIVQSGLTCIIQRQLLECQEPQRGRLPVDAAALDVGHAYIAQRVRTCIIKHQVDLWNAGNYSVLTSSGSNKLQGIPSTVKMKQIYLL